MEFHLPDPRLFAPSESALANPLIAEAEANLAAEVAVIASKHEARLCELMVTALLAGDMAPVAQAVAAAPSLAVLRMLTRQLDRAQVEAARRKYPQEGVATTVFALPLVIVAGSPHPIQVPGALTEIAEFVALMRAGKALRGNQNFGLSNALVASTAFELERLPATLDWWAEASEVEAPLALERAPLSLPANEERVFLRFLIGRALAAPGVDLLTERDCASWGMAFTQAFARQLGSGQVSLLAMARPPRTPLAALYQGRIAQREVSLQLFATQAIRKFRSSVGEPAAVISAHRTASGGEVRLSLSNPFDEKGAEGFRAELFPTDSAQAVAQDMQNLLRDCGVEDITILADIFPDTDPLTRLPLLFRADALDSAVAQALRLH